MKKERLLICFLLAIGLCVSAQSGKGAFKLLDLPASARMAAMGGTNVSLPEGDLNLAANNPSLLNGQSHNVLSFNYGNYFTDLNFGNIAYGHNFGDKNFCSFGVSYLDYGKFLGTTEDNQQTGKFTAKDMMLHASYARYLHPRWTIGLSFKPMLSVYERYKSFGFSFDAGLSYADKKNEFYAGLAIRNLGMSIDGYYSLDGNRNLEMLPWNIELGLTKGFKHAPVRISMTAHNLQRWNLAYTDKSLSENKKEPTKAGTFFDMLFRHTIFNLEILPTKNMYLLVSYNYRRGQELRVEDYKTAAGLAFGAGIKVYKFHIDVGFAQYQVGHYSFHATFSTFLSEFGVKTAKKPNAQF